MIRHSLLTIALIIVGSAALAPETMAQTADVPFTANVGGVCNFIKSPLVNWDLTNRLTQLH